MLKHRDSRRSGNDLDQVAKTFVWSRELIFREDLASKLAHLVNRMLLADFHHIRVIETARVLLQKMRFREFEFIKVHGNAGYRDR